MQRIRTPTPVAALATHGPAVALADGSDAALVNALAAATDSPRATIWRGQPPDGHDLEWDALMRAGRTDPAPTAELPATAEAFVVGAPHRDGRADAGG